MQLSIGDLQEIIIPITANLHKVIIITNSIIENSVDYVTIHSNSPDRGFEKTVAQLTKSSVSSILFMEGNSLLGI